jgi:O-antigen/teichoic acid export membrane protein
LLDFGPVTHWNLLAVLVADLLFGRAAQLCVNVHMATGKSGRQSTVTVIVGACRLAAIAVAALAYSKLTLTIWVWWYLGSSILGALMCVGSAIRHYGWPEWRWMPGTLRDGFSFSAENAVQSALKDLDKPIVLQLLGATAAGEYATAFRVIDTLVMPLYALAYATYGKMFRKAAESVGECLAYSLKLLPLALAVGTAVGLGALLCAGLLPFIFGKAYQELPWMVRLLSPMPVLIGAFMIGGDALSATGRQTTRLIVVSLSLSVTLLLYPWAIRLAGVEGAMLIRLVGGTITAVLVWALLPWANPLWRRSQAGR